MDIKYVVMPITKEQKQKYNRTGFRVIDAQFAPDGEKIENPNEKQERKQKEKSEDKAE